MNRHRQTFHVNCVFLTVYIFLYSTLTKVLDVSIWKSPVAGWGWESIEAKDDWLRWLPVPFGLGFHLTMCVWPLPPWSLADLTGSHDDSSLLPIDQGRWWGLPLVFMLTANISGATLVTNLQSKKKCCKWELENQISDCHLVKYHIPKRCVCVSLHCSYSIWSNSVLDHDLCGYFFSVCVTGFRSLERTSLSICLCN